MIPRKAHKYSVHNESDLDMLGLSALDVCHRFLPLQAKVMTSTAPNENIKDNLKD